MIVPRSMDDVMISMLILMKMVINEIRLSFNDDARVTTMITTTTTTMTTTTTTTTMMMMMMTMMIDKKKLGRVEEQIENRPFPYTNLESTQGTHKETKSRLAGTIFLSTIFCHKYH